jgi:hypothetical protein
MRWRCAVMAVCYLRIDGVLYALRGARDPVPVTRVTERHVRTTVPVAVTRKPRRPAAR